MKYRQTVSLDLEFISPTKSLSGGNRPLFWALLRYVKSQIRELKSNLGAKEKTLVLTLT